MVNLGLKHGVNLLVGYDAAWEQEFRDEKLRIDRALPSGIAKDIQHYGSTAVPGLRAKPILDILVGVDPLSDWEACRGPLESIGYDYAEHAGVPGHYIFGRGRDTTERTHLVHIVHHQGTSWRYNLAFRDALRRDPALCAAYVRAKEVAAADAPTGRGQYNELKGLFIQRVHDELASQGEAIAAPAGPPEQPDV